MTEQQRNRLRDLMTREDYPLSPSEGIEMRSLMRLWNEEQEEKYRQYVSSFTCEDDPITRSDAAW